MGVLVGKHAPSFNTKAVLNGEIVDGFSLSRYLGQYVVFFFYPLDFTFVCPTELHAFQDAIADFQTRNTQVIACSVDSCYSHLAWLGQSKDLGGIAGISYPIVADLNKTIARTYGVLQEEAGVAYRGLFLIDKTGVVRHQVVNDLPLGRSVTEALRMVDALSFHETHGEVCPANWTKGQKALRPSTQDVARYLSQSS